MIVFKLKLADVRAQEKLIRGSVSGTPEFFVCNKHPLLVLF
jgi:hypothetical protein